MKQTVWDERLNVPLRQRLDASFYGGMFLGFILGLEIGLWWLR